MTAKRNCRVVATSVASRRSIACFQPFALMTAKLVIQRACAFARDHGGTDGMLRCARLAKSGTIERLFWREHDQIADANWGLGDGTMLGREHFPCVVGRIFGFKPVAAVLDLSQSSPQESGREKLLNQVLIFRIPAFVTERVN